MARHVRLAALLLAPALLLAGCGGSTDEGLGGAADRVALGDDIIADPDLVGQNQANAAVSAGTGGSLPTAAFSQAALQDARAKAVNLVGGPGMMKNAPPPQDAGTLPPNAALNVALRAAATGGAGNCVDSAEYTMSWAARLPATFPVYPNGATQEAAGTDRDGCSLRVVSFLTALPLDEVMDFYYTRATNAGYSTQRAIDEGDDMLGGIKDGGASYIVSARPLQSGGTEVDLITNGG